MSAGELARRARASRASRVVRAQDGFVAGAEAGVFGVLVFMVGTLVVLSGWVVIDSKMAVEAAAREAVRGYVESEVDAMANGQAAALAERLAISTMESHRGARDPDDPRWSVTDLRIDGEVARCGMIEGTFTITVDTVALPLIGGGFGTVTLVGSHRERIEPYRSGLPIPPGGVRCD